ncbi:unnamed protein product [Peronospora destructor]|uniref:ZNF380 coiled-coil domain-containing protein n=1 Tax=Peronospora destructor TaxID=86335 RepID=A0AAV0V4M4_9STRA|nr:unnamed protein product [Peronospora destructor]
MGSRQDEIRRLMKEAKHKPRTTGYHRQTGSSIIAKPSTVPVISHAKAQKFVIPIGFFDNSLADAKARNVDVQELAKKQLETEWEAFQEFAAEVEKQSVEEEKVQVHETKEREAVEQLENMKYVDKYRMVLERVTCLRNGEKRRATDDVVEDDGEEGDSSAAVMAVNEYKKKQKKRKKQQQLVSGESDDLDPCNWRSRGI